MVIQEAKTSKIAMKNIEKPQEKTMKSIEFRSLSPRFSFQVLSGELEDAERCYEAARGLGNSKDTRLAGARLRLAQQRHLELVQEDGEEDGEALLLRAQLLLRSLLDGDLLSPMGPMVCL